MQPTDAVQKLRGEIRPARLGLAKAESRLVRAKPPACFARQRRRLSQGGGKVFAGKGRMEVAIESGAQTGIAATDKSPSTPSQNLDNTAINTQETS